MHAVVRQQRHELLEELLARRRVEVLADRADRAAVLVLVCAGTDVERHQKTSGQKGGSGVRRRAAARSTAPGVRSSIRPAACRRASVDPAEVEGREVVDPEHEVGGVAGPPRPGAEPIAAVVPGTEGVANLGNERVVGVPGTGAQRGIDVDEAKPQPVLEPEPEAPRVAHAEEERSRRVEEAGTHLRGQVDREEEAPDLLRGAKRRPERLADAHRARGEPLVPVSVVPVDGVALVGPVEREHRVETRPGSRRRPQLLQALLTPPGLAAGEHPGAADADALVERRQHVECLLLRDQADRARRAGVVAEREGRAVGVERVHRRAHAVAEAPVDQRLGGPERRQRLAALVQVVELATHQLAGQAAAPVRRVDAHPGDACRTGARRPGS